MDKQKIEELVDKFIYHHLVEDLSVSLSGRKAGFKFHKCINTYYAMRHPEYFKAKIIHLMRKSPNRVTQIKKLKEQYEKSLRN